MNTPLNAITSSGITDDRIDILHNESGKIDVLVGVNLLERALIYQKFHCCNFRCRQTRLLRNERSLIQTIGRLQT